MEAWQNFLSVLEQDLGVEIVQKWIPRIVRFDAGNLYLEAQDSFQINWFEEHVRPRLKGLLNNNQRPIRVHLETLKKAPFKQEEPKVLSFAPDPLDPEMTLEHFIPSPKNLIAHKLLQNSSPYNPIFLFGPKGSGKTHLLMAAAADLKKKGKRVFFVRAETFTEHVVQAIRLGQMQEFRKVYRDIEALIIDDIHIFSRKNATQEEFFHTFNTLHTSGKQILLSAHTPPMQLTEIEPRLISRFEWGISLGLEVEDQKAILEKKGELWKMGLKPEMVQYLLDTFPRNPLMALQALAFRSRGENVSIGVAAKLLKDLIEQEQSKVLNFDQVIKTVAGHYGIKSEDLLGKSQMREYALPRQVAMYFCREKLKLPFQKIGDLFGRDHSTVMSSVKQIQKSIDEKKIEPPLMEG